MHLVIVVIHIERTCSQDYLIINYSIYACYTVQRL